MAEIDSLVGLSPPRPSPVMVALLLLVSTAKDLTPVIRLWCQLLLAIRAWSAYCGTDRPVRVCESLVVPHLCRTGTWGTLYRRNAKYVLSSLCTEQRPLTVALCVPAVKRCLSAEKVSAGTFLNECRRCRNGELTKGGS